MNNDLKRGVLKTPYELVFGISRREGLVLRDLPASIVELLTTEEGLKGTDLDMINRWRKFEGNRGGKPHMSMREHYLEIKLILKRILAYSKAL